MTDVVFALQVSSFSAPCYCLVEPAKDRESRLKVTDGEDTVKARSI
jgi:hypothetical protein